MGNRERDELFYCITHGEKSRALDLITLTEDINKKEQGGISYLLAATQNYQVEIVEALLKSGADPNCYDDKGMSPIKYAISNKHLNSLEIVKKLLEYNVDLDMKVQGKKSAREVAEFLNLQEYIKLFNNY